MQHWNRPREVRRNRLENVSIHKMTIYCDTRPEDWTWFINVMLSWPQSIRRRTANEQLWPKPAVRQLILQEIYCDIVNECRYFDCRCCDCKLLKYSMGAMVFWREGIVFGVYEFISNRAIQLCEMYSNQIPTLYFDKDAIINQWQQDKNDKNIWEKENQTKIDCIYHFPIDLPPNGIWSKCFNCNRVKQCILTIDDQMNASLYKQIMNTRVCCENLRRARDGQGQGWTEGKKLEGRVDLKYEMHGNSVGHGWVWIGGGGEKYGVNEHYTFS